MQILYGFSYTNANTFDFFQMQIQRLYKSIEILCKDF